MKSFALVILVVQAVILQSVYSQVLRSSRVVSGPIVGPVLNSPCGCGPVLNPPCGCSGPVISAPVLSPVVSAPVVSSVVSPTVVSAVPSVANSLADTLSLLTVSSLLADTLPLAYPNVVSSVPVFGGCGCGSYGYSFL